MSSARPPARSCGDAGDEELARHIPVNKAPARVAAEARGEAEALREQGRGEGRTGSLQRVLRAQEGKYQEEDRTEQGRTSNAGQLTGRGDQRRSGEHEGILAVNVLIRKALGAADGNAGTFERFGD